MREIDKLAVESWKSSDQWPNESDYAHIMGFQAGFRKARRIMLAHIDHICDEKTPTDFVKGLSYLVMLGENEIE